MAYPIKQRPTNATTLGIVGGGRHNLGPRNAPALHAVIMEVYLNIPLFVSIHSVYKLFTNTKFPTESELTHMVQDSVYQPLLTYMFNLINIVVPRDSARLRNILEIALRDQSKTGNLNPFQVFLDTTGVEYAPYVNNMPTSWLQHPGNHNPNSPRTKKGRKKTPKFLYDPQAQQGFFYILTDKGRMKAEQSFNDFLRKFSTTYLDKYSTFYSQSLAKQLGFANYYNLGQALFSPRRFK